MTSLHRGRRVCVRAAAVVIAALAVLVLPAATASAVSADVPGVARTATTQTALAPMPDSPSPTDGPSGGPNGPAGPQGPENDTSDTSVTVDLGGLTDKPSTWDSTLATLLGNDQDTAAPAARDMIGYFASRQAALGDRLLADLDRLTGVRGMEALCLECEASTAPERAHHRRLPSQFSLVSLLARLLD